jgi:hypothetical protein
MISDSRVRVRTALAVVIPIGLAIALIVAFPAVARFAEGAALSLRRFWWLVLIGALAGWLAWTLRSRNPS